MLAVKKIQKCKYFTFTCHLFLWFNEFRINVSYTDLIWQYNYICVILENLLSAVYQSNSIFSSSFEQYKASDICDVYLFPGEQVIWSV